MSISKITFNRSKAKVVEPATIILPVQNAESTIESTLHHLLDVLEDQYPQFQIVVEDRGSNDSTVEVVEELAQKVPQIRILEKSGNINRQNSENEAITEFTFENLNLSEIEFEDQEHRRHLIDTKNTPIDADDVFYQYLIGEDPDDETSQLETGCESFGKNANCGANQVPDTLPDIRADQAHRTNESYDLSPNVISHDECHIASYHLG